MFTYISNSNESSHIHSWNDEDYGFYYQLYKVGVYNYFHNYPAEVTKTFKAYIEIWEIYYMNSKIQYLHTILLVEYGCLALYDEYLNKMITIDHE